MGAPHVFEELLTDTRIYARDCLKIRDKAGRIVPLIFSSGQMHIHNRLEEQQAKTGRVRAVILKGRQQMASTYVTARHFKRIATETGQRAYILTHEDKATANLFEMVQRYHTHLPDVLRPKLGPKGAKELYFGRLDSGYIVGTAGTKGTGRSGNIQFFHGSEVSYWANAKEHIAGVGQSVPNEPGTEIIYESTANGIGNLFHSKWQTATAGQRDEGDDSDYLPIFIPWFWQSEYRRTPPPAFALDDDEQEYANAFNLDMEQMYWRRLKIRDEFQGDVGMFDQEYPATPELAFRTSTAECLIPPLLVTNARKSHITPDPQAVKLWGMDPAEYGDDRSSLAKRQGRVIPQVKYWSKKGPDELVGIVAIEYDREPEPKPEAIFVDTSSTVAVCEGLQKLNIPAIGVHFGESAYEDALYKNRRAEMAWDFLAWFRNKPTRIPDEDQLQADLVTPRMKPDASRKRQLESKEAMKRRGLKSPDGFDACILTFAIKVALSQKGNVIIRKPGSASGAFASLGI